MTIPMDWILIGLGGLGGFGLLATAVNSLVTRKQRKKGAEEKKHQEDKKKATRLLPEPWLTLYTELNELSVYEHARKAFVEWLKSANKPSLPKLSGEAVDFFLYEQLIDKDDCFDKEAQECFELLLPFMKFPVDQSRISTVQIQKSCSSGPGNVAVDSKLIADVEKLTNLAMKISKNIRTTDEIYGQRGHYHIREDMVKLETLAAAVESRVRLLVPEDPEYHPAAYPAECHPPEGLRLDLED